jgi:hypothetical protein
VHERSRRLHFVQEFRPKRFHHVVVFVGKLDEVVSVDELPDLLQVILVDEIEEFFHLCLNNRSARPGTGHICRVRVSAKTVQAG